MTVLRTGLNRRFVAFGVFTYRGTSPSRKSINCALISQGVQHSSVDVSCALSAWLSAYDSGVDRSSIFQKTRAPASTLCTSIPRAMQEVLGLTRCGSFCPSGGAKGSSDLTVSLSLASFQSVVRQLNLPSAMISALSLAVPRTELWTSNKGTFTEGTSERVVLKIALICSTAAQLNRDLLTMFSRADTSSAGIQSSSARELGTWAKLDV